MRGLVLCLLMAFQLQAASFHAIIVVDTKDEQHGKYLAKDQGVMEDRVKKIAKVCGLKLKKTVLCGKSVKTSKLYSTIKKLKSKPDDVILFYFTGHGYRTREKDLENNPWPNLYFSKEVKGVDFFEVSTLLEEKDFRFLFLFADVCNTAVPEAFAPLMARAAPVPFIDTLTQDSHIRSLFLDFSGVIRATASTAGTFAWTEDQGGVFTRSFFTGLDFVAKGEETPSWERVFEMSAKLLQGPRIFQVPYYEIYYK